VVQMVVGTAEVQPTLTHLPDTSTTQEVAQVSSIQQPTQATVHPVTPGYNSTAEQRQQVTPHTRQRPVEQKPGTPETDMHVLRDLNKIPLKCLHNHATA